MQGRWRSQECRPAQPCRCHGFALRLIAHVGELFAEIGDDSSLKIAMENHEAAGSAWAGSGVPSPASAHET